jgi:nicotinate-nucleotide adenylyltransferase
MQGITDGKHAFLDPPILAAYGLRMQASDRAIGILGGTFNPVHHGHLLLARDALESLGLDRVLLVPNARSPLRVGEDLAPASLRLEMVRAALEGELGLEAHPLEVERGGRSYTVETLEALALERPGVAWTFLIGADSLDTLERWHRIGDILRMASLVVVPRPGYPLAAALQALYGRSKACEGRISVLPGKREVDIRATEVRQRIATGRSIRYLVPPAVEALIHRHGLYRSSPQRA